MKWLPEKICGRLYHRFGYRSEFCVRCGVKKYGKYGSGSITSSEYDDTIPVFLIMVNLLFVMVAILIIIYL